MSSLADREQRREIRAIKLDQRHAKVEAVHATALVEREAAAARLIEARQRAADEDRERVSMMLPQVTARGELPLPARIAYWDHGAGRGAAQ
jgi:hypothetical protein